MQGVLVDRLLELVRRNYDEIAADFDITRKKAVWPEMQTLTDCLRAGDRVLDAGCGNGRLLEVLKNKDIDYCGFDNSAALLDRARRNYPGQKFLQGDILDLSFIGSHKFDYIFCLAVLQHLPGENLRRNALQELKNKLSGQGRIILSVWNLWEAKCHQRHYRWLIFYQWLLSWSGFSAYPHLDFGDLVFPWKNSRGEIISQRYYHAFRQRELENLVHAAGFKIDYLKKDKHNYWLILK